MSLEFTLVRRAISLAVIDGPDAGDNPDILQAQGSVLFEPVIKKGDSIQVQTRGGSETYALAPIECPINDGIISHRGQDGVKLPAGGEAANPSLIRWKATFSRMQAGGKSFTLAPVVFDAVPGGEIDLTMVAPVAGAPEGVVRGPRGTSLESIIVDGSELVFTAVDDAGSFEIARIPLDEMVRAEAEAAADGVRDALAVDVAASQSARDAAEGHANRAATSESNAATSETNAKQSETNAGDYAAVATTAATEAVDAMERATDLAGGNFTTHEYVDGALSLKADKTYVDSTVWLKPALGASSNIDTLPSGFYPVPNNSVATGLGMPYTGPGELVTTWLDSSGIRRRQTYYSDRTGSGAGMDVHRRTYYNGTWSPWTLELNSRPSLLGTANLDDVTENGTYFQASSRAGTRELNYPVVGDGSTGVATLRVTASSGVVEQVLTEFRNGRMHFRGRSAAGSWNDWTTLTNQTVADPEVPEVPDKPGLPVLDMEVTGKWTPNANGDQFLIELAEKHELVTVEEIGRSVRDWPIYAAIIGDPTLPAVLVVSGQHGTEVGTHEGAWLWCRELTKQKTLALMDVCVIVVPMVNPDNRFVARGNKNAVDLNRDWVDLSQPETQAVATLFNDYNIVAAVDVHNFGYPRQTSYKESEFGDEATLSLAAELFGAVETALVEDGQPARRYGPAGSENTFLNAASVVHEVPSVLVEIPCGGYGDWTFDVYTPAPSWQAYILQLTCDAVLSHVAENIDRYNRGGRSNALHETPT